MASLTFSAAKSLFAQYITSQGSVDPDVGSALNFVNERFITSGMWRGNRFIQSFSVYQGADSNFYFNTIPGVESIMKVIAIDSTLQWGEIVTVQGDWYQFNDEGLGWLQANYAGDTQVFRVGNVPVSALPSGTTADTQTYRIVGMVPETRTMYCLVRRGYVPLVNDTDLLVPSNINAYRYGVQAYHYENINELERAQVYWNLAYECLNQETESSEEGVQDQVQIQWKSFAPGIIQNLV